MAHPILDNSGVAAPISESKSATVPQLVKMDGEFQTSDFTQLSHDHVRRSRRHRTFKSG
jgi:hypothetical protein